MRRVVVTGLGVLSPNGLGKEAFWSACSEGRSGVGPIRAFDASGHAVRIAGEVAPIDPAPYVPESQRKSLAILSRAMRFAIVAAGQAVADSGLDFSREERPRIAVMMGAGMIPYELSELAPLLNGSLRDGQFDPTALGRTHGEGLPSLWLLKYLPNMISAHISLCFGAEGPNSTVTTACAAGTQAVGEAFRSIARGDADLALAGGADSRLDPLILLAYERMGVLSPARRPASEVSRPFDAERDGFVLGEGAAVLVLEELEHARQRRAEVYAEICGLGTSFDAYSVVRAHPDARGAVSALENALREARVDKSEIGYLNAHGTGTRLNDPMETFAMKKVFGADAKRRPLSSIKSMIGHTIGAAGAIDAAALALTLKTGILPPTINLTHPDPECDLDYVPNVARRADVRVAVSTSFGFGGQNAALVMKRFS